MARAFPTRLIPTRLIPARVRELLGAAAPGDAVAGRSRSRNRRIAASAATAMFAKLLSVGVALLTVPLTLGYLGSERYGMWLIMSSFVAILSFADLGVGNGVLNTVAAAHGRDDRAAIRAAVSSGMAALIGVAIVIAAGFALAYPHLDWFRMFNVDTPLARAEAGPALAVFVACFALAIPTGVVQRVQMGLQQGFVASLWQCAGSLFALVGVLLAIWMEAGLPWLVLGFMGGPLLASAANSLNFFGRSHRDIAPRPSAATRAAAAAVMRTGLLFLLLQLAAAVTYNSGSLIIAQTLGAAAVPQYAVPERLFSLITMVAAMGLAPLWPAYRESITRGDAAWARRTLRTSIRVAVGYAALLSIPLIFASPWIIRLWVGDAVDSPFLLLLGFGLWKILEAGGLAMAMFLNGAHVIKPQLLSAIAMACAAVILSIVLVDKFGVAGIIWGTLTAYFTCALIPYVILSLKTLQVIERAKQKPSKERHHD